MKNLKLLAFLLLLAPCSLPLRAQSTGTISSYSRFGLGVLHDQSNGLSKSMGGVGAGVRVGNRINSLNPASYSAIDSLSLILDVGMSGSFGKMNLGAKTVGVNSATLDYVHVGMHIAKRLGLAAGFMPYTSIGYKFYSPERVIGYNQNSSLAETFSGTYIGSGGLNQAYIGLGWKAFRNFSIGANAGLLWGKYSHSVVPDFQEGGTSSSSYSSTIKTYYASMLTYKIDLGAQYSIRLSSQDWLNLGITAGIGHKIAQDASLTLFTIKGDTTEYTASSPFDLPYSYAFGASWQHKNTLMVAADVRHERWGNCRMPVETPAGYVPMEGSYKNMTKIGVGAQWTPDPYVKAYWKRIQYRAGISYTTPYLKVDGKDGPMELRMGMGVGLPITNKRNNRSVVNVGVQWLRRSSGAVGLKEDYFVINLGMTFNERWFVKYKIN